jgi:hypothetical protein
MTMTNGEGPAVWVGNHRWGERRFYFEDEDDDEDDVSSAIGGALSQGMASVSTRAWRELFSKYVLPGFVRLR